MSSRGRASRAYRVVIRLFSALVWAFFRRVQVTGKNHIPSTGGILVSWHPNGLIDPGLILTAFPYPIVFGARHGIFKWPGLGALMRAIGTVPIYRAVDLPDQDPKERAAANLKSLEALAGKIAGGSFSSLFPEGISHDAPYLKELKTGAARLYYQALSAVEPGQSAPVIIPVGLHYDGKDLFRSNALVEFFPPIRIDGDLTPSVDDTEEQRRDKVKRLTREIERILKEVVLATESWDLYRLMHRGRKLARAERAKRAGARPGRSTMSERVVGFARVREAYKRVQESHPEQHAKLQHRVEEYDADLQALSLEDHELDQPPRLIQPALVLLLIAQVIAVYLLLPPFLVVGIAVNLPAALFVVLMSKWASKLRKDEATVKILLGAILFPLSWLASGYLAFQAHVFIHGMYPSIPNYPWVSGLTVALAAAIGGAFAVRYVRVARETARAVRVRLTRRMSRQAVERLRVERSDLFDELIAMTQGMELPGQVLSDGRVGS